MKTNMRLDLSSLCRWPKIYLCALLLVPHFWPGGSSPQGATVGSVGAWGWDGAGQTDVPVAAQSSVIAIAAGSNHTVALKADGSAVAWGTTSDGLKYVTVLPDFSGVVAIAARGFLTVGLKTDGTVVAWGEIYDGTKFVPATVPAGLSAVTAIAAGFSHTVALKTDGTVAAWGKIMDGTNYVDVTVPIGLSNVTAIAAGFSHTVALKADSSVVAWGANDSGQVTGTPSTGQFYSATASPVALGGQLLNGVKGISAGGTYNVAVRDDGSVVAWGTTYDGVNYVPATVPPGLSGVTAIAAGDSHTVALKNDGTVVAWGRNFEGQVTGIQTSELPSSATANPVNFGGQVLTGVIAIAAGGLHTVVLVTPPDPTITMQPMSQAVAVWQSSSFTVAATGFPLNYQWRKDGVTLAGATSATYSLPVTQTNKAGGYTVVVSNSTGSVTSAPPAVLTVNAIAAPGTVVAWGYSSYLKTTVPVAAQSGVIAVAVGGTIELGRAHTAALKTDGSVVAWTRGYDSGGQATVPAGLSGVTAIAVGVWHTVALKNDGTVVVWKESNDNDFGGQMTVPAGLSGVMAIAAGAWHTVALKNDGSVVAWGQNGSGEVTGTPTNDKFGNAAFASASPVILGGRVLTGVTAIAAGLRFTVALKNDGSVVVWGDDSYGQTTMPSAAQRGVKAIAAGASHIAALKNDGSVVTWGDDEFGQVTGTPTIDEFGNFSSGTASPVILGGQVLAGVTAIAAADRHTAALKDDGSVVVWGDNFFGQVTGTSTTNFLLSATGNPVTLGGQILSGVTVIAAGGEDNLAIVGTAVALHLKRNGNDLVLSWPAKAAEFTLQSTYRLTPSVTWIDSIYPLAMGSTQLTVTNTNSGGAQFYRLKKP